MSDENGVESTPPLKYSRYRSVRDPQRHGAEPIQQAQKEQEDNMQRTKSMSRYRRSRVVPKERVASPPIPEVPVPTLPRAQQTINPSARVPKRIVTEPLPNRSSPHSSPRDFTFPANPQPQGRPRETENERLRRKVKEFQEREAKAARARERQAEQERRAQEEKAQQDRKAREAQAEEYRKAKEARALQERKVREAKAEQDRLRQKQQQEEENIRLAEEEAARILAEQKKKDLERLQAELDAAKPVTSLKSPKDKFAFFSRKRAATRSSPPTTSSGSAHGSGGISVNGSGPPVSHTKSRDPPPQAIEQGGGGIVPQTDAPISASNAGERRVLIRCKQSSINLPITPETTPVDIVYSAANVMTQNITPSAAILIESYTQLGLERRVRRYEHIRDIMNSWDRDTQNSFLIQNSDSPNYDTDLESSGIPKNAPADVTVHMYHSQKPGKWNKRYITLLSSGQMFTSKKAGAKMSDKDCLSICHLSDFDIYTPTPQQTRKNLKPPKKYCYAVKSQQKTTMFLSTENFVHFFSTDDDKLSNKFYDAVQSWRSWYLVNRMGEGSTKNGKNFMEITETRGRPGTRGGPAHTVKLSVDENPYTIGSFTPLLDLGRFGSPDGDSYDSEEEDRPRQIPFHLRNSVSLSPVDTRRESKRHPPPVSYRLPPEAEEEFASSGLLGRTYSQRQKIAKDREATQAAGPFMDGPSLLNGPTHNRTLSMKSTRTTRRPETSAGLQRTPSQRMPKPLLDFTPQFKEAPQWDKTGKGHGVAAPTGLPLVEVATTPNDPMAEIPRNNVFRRDTTIRPATSGKGLNGGSMMNRGRVNYD